MARPVLRLRLGEKLKRQRSTFRDISVNVSTRGLRRFCKIEPLDWSITPWEARVSLKWTRKWLKVFTAFLFSPSSSHSFPFCLKTLPLVFSYSSHRPTPALDFEPFPLPHPLKNLPAMFVSFIGLVLASTISAKVIDIQVSDSNASLKFTPEAIVSFNCHYLIFTSIDDHLAGRRSR